MSAMTELSIDLQQAVLEGDLSVDEIARMFEVPRTWVVEAAHAAYYDVESELHHDELERDYDEPYEPEEPDRFDAWYEEQYDLGDY